MTGVVRRLPLGVGAALVAAALFGASTPLAKLLLTNVAPVMLAGLLYASSGLGLGLWWGIRRLHRASCEEAPLRRPDWPWLGGAVLAGGVLGPVLLMWGLASTPAPTASLLLSLEGVLTAAIAWVVFRENVDRRVFLGMVAIVAGGVLLSWSQAPEGLPWGALAIAAACACWAIDNNLTRHVSAGDPVQIAASRAAPPEPSTSQSPWRSAIASPEPTLAVGAGVIGLAGYGISLVLFVLALRQLGTPRTGAYFATARFLGAALSLLIFREQPEMVFWIAGGLMALGVWLHLSETHAHDHEHEAMEHEHRHRHDDHHQHEHYVAWDGSEPHSPPHTHVPMRHAHPHYPDLHHRHEHH